VLPFASLEIAFFSLAKHSLGKIAFSFDSRAQMGGEVS
jgi:hypothetical protein